MDYRVKAAAAFVALALAGCAQAATMGLHLGSVHQSPGFNNINPGVYVRLDNGATAGTYRNSLGRQTLYAGYTWEQEGGPFAVSALALTGYYLPVVVTLIPSIRIPITQGMAARVSYVYAPAKGSAVHLSAEWRF